MSCKQCGGAMTHLGDASRYFHCPTCGTRLRCVGSHEEWTAPKLLGLVDDLLSAVPALGVIDGPAYRSFMAALRKVRAAVGRERVVG